MRMKAPASWAIGLLGARAAVQHLLALEPIAAEEIGFGRGRRKAVAFKDEAEERYAWTRHFSRLPSTVGTGVMPSTGSSLLVKGGFASGDKA